MTRRRCALILLLVLIWILAGPWLGLGRVATARATVIAGAPAFDRATWLPSAAGSEQLARLAGQQSTLSVLAAALGSREPLPPSRPRGLRPILRQVHPRPHTSRAVDERDEPS